ncbi:hypothetical protein [Paenibacillus naphthalenovorans]|uniref:hypothetical protein n=1 Tax=Paenibacillus naphthalenovorans TaxID=162209 RepID=UPI003D2B1931
MRLFIGTLSGSALLCRGRVPFAFLYTFVYTGSGYRRYSRQWAWDEGHRQFTWDMFCTYFVVGCSRMIGKNEFAKKSIAFLVNRCYFYFR